MKKKITILQLSLAAAMVVPLLAIAIPFPILQVYAQTQNNTATTSISQSINELINSVALLVGVVAPLIVSGLAYVKSKSQDPKINEAIETGIHVGRIATATANKALENKQNIKSLIEVGLKAAPNEV